MLKDITFGQFFPGKSVIHRLDPRVKLILSFLYIIVLFIASNYISYGILLGFLIVSITLSRLNLKVILRGMKPLVFIVVFSSILNLLYTPGDVLVEFWVFQITTQGLITAGYMILRILMLITSTFLLTYTTSPMMLTDAIERLLKPLNKIKVPVHELAMMMTIALRFIPTLIEETDKIMNAQKARGADFESGNLLKRAKALIPLLVPLFVSAFRRADELAVAMECRCYNGGEGRTRMRQLALKSLDAYTVLISLAIFTASLAFSTFLL